MKTHFAILFVTLLATLELTSAANIKEFFHKKCKGGHRLFRGISPNNCGTSHSPVRSIGFSKMPHNAECLGWQAGGNDQACFQVRARKNTGGGNHVCLLHPHGNGGPQFAGASWIHGGASKRDEGNTTEAEKCTGQVNPDAVVLDDGHLYGLPNMPQVMIDELYGFAGNGTVSGNLPSIFKAYEEDAAGVQERLQEMQEEEDNSPDDDDDEKNGYNMARVLGF